MTTLEKLVKLEIRKIVKRNGSHLGVVRRLITEKFDVDFDLYVDFTKKCINKKFNNVEDKIRSNIRFQ